MNAAALVSIAAVGIGVIGGSIQALGFLQRRRERRARPQSNTPEVPPTLPPAVLAHEAKDAFPLPDVPAPLVLPPRDHFALSRGDGAVRVLPGGAVTLLFTDIVGSTWLWQEQPNLMGLALARHDALLHAIVPRHHGHVFKTVGDAFYAVFATASDGATATLAAQRAVRAELWHPDAALHIRIALHSGAAEQRGGDYFGSTLNQIARMLASGHGDQVRVSAAAFALIQDCLPPDTSLRGLGLVRLRDLTQPELLFQLVHPALPHQFPPLRSLDTLPNNLPQPVTSFIGREKETAEVKALLSQTRLWPLKPKAHFCIRPAAGKQSRFCLLDASIACRFYKLPRPLPAAC